MDNTLYITNEDFIASLRFYVLSKVWENESLTDQDTEIIRLLLELGDKNGD